MADQAVYNPTFVLRKVNVEEIIKKLQNNHYFTIKDRPKIEVVKSQSVLDITSKSANFKNNVDSSGQSIITISYGEDKFEEFVKHGMKFGRRCLYCTDDVDPSTALGYPEGNKDETYIIGDKYLTYYIFWISGTFDTFNCAAAYLIAHNMQSHLHRLNFMFSLMYKNRQLVPAPSPLLLISNGGSATKEEWLNEKFIFKKVPTVKFLPIRQDFIVSSST